MGRTTRLQQGETQTGGWQGGNGKNPLIPNGGNRLNLLPTLIGQQFDFHALHPLSPTDIFLKEDVADLGTRDQGYLTTLSYDT